jgi:hypothetical protein
MLMIKFRLAFKTAPSCEFQQLYLGASQKHDYFS